MEELGFRIADTPIRMFMDNNATLTQVSLVKFNLGRTRHLRAVYFNTMHAKRANFIEPRRIDTNENISDINTKHLGSTKFRSFFFEVQGSDELEYGKIKTKVVKLLRRLSKFTATRPEAPQGGADRPTPGKLMIAVPEYAGTMLAIAPWLVC